MIHMARVLLQNSGGLDSIVTAAILHQQGHEVYSVFIDMGQPSRERAMISAQNIADRFCIDHEVITIRSNKRDCFATSNHLSEEEAKKLPMRVPFGSTTTTAISSLVVCNDRIPYVASGTKGSIRLEHSQSTQRENLRRIFANIDGKETGFTITHPLEGLDFGGTITKAYELGLTKEDLGSTVSCNLKEPCGKCYKCIERAKYGITQN
jgi:7-cyano-7-deazaguanine synthase in queuosine biosynthesis